MTVKGDRLYSFKLFGYSFLIWKKAKAKALSGGGTINGACRIVKQDRHIVLAMPSGEVIPYQRDLTITAPLNDVTYATVDLFVTLESPDTIKKAI